MQYEEALMHLKLAETHSINEPEIHIGLGRLLDEYLNNPKDALYHLKKAIVLNPAMAEAHFRLAQYQERHHNITEALNSYRKAIELNTNFPGFGLSFQSILMME